MKKHTPTPWKSAIMLKDRSFYDQNNIPVGHCNETGEDLREQLRVGEAVVIANTYQGLPDKDGGGYSKAAANARYLVHCVNCHDELLEMLTALVELIPEPPLVSGGFDSPPEHATEADHQLGYALHLARAAIAKATASEGAI